jgi:phosphate transport system substrate-binding protein
MPRFNIRDSLLGTCALAALTLGVSGAAQAQSQINGGGSTLAGPVYSTLFNNLTGQLDPTVHFNYALVGSGAGARGVLCNDGSQLNTAGVTVHYGASDNPLTAAQITAWNTNAAQSGGCAVQNGGKATGGPLMQIPTIGTPITFAYNTVRQTANGGLTFTDAQLCGIFSGKITSWTDAALSGISTKNAPTGPITVVYRTDGSGTSALFTAHLNAVCTPATSNISFTSTQTFAQLFSPVPSNFVGASGSGAVAAAIGLNAALNGGTVTGTSGAIGYISPDFTQIASIHRGGLFPPVAKVVNSHLPAGPTAAVLPDFADTTAALQKAALPSGSDLQDGTKYVPTIADPTVGYPVVGYTTWIMPTCYQDNNVVNGIYEFFSQIYTAPDYVSVIQQQGFVQLPSTLVALLNNNIFGNNNGFNIDVQDTNICVGGGASGAGTFVGR